MVWSEGGYAVRVRLQVAPATTRHWNGTGAWPSPILSVSLGAGRPPGMPVAVANA